MARGVVNGQGWQFVEAREEGRSQREGKMKGEEGQARVGQQIVQLGRNITTTITSHVLDQVLGLEGTRISHRDRDALMDTYLLPHVRCGLYGIPALSLRLALLLFRSI